MHKTAPIGEKNYFQLWTCLSEWNSQPPGDLGSWSMCMLRYRQSYRVIILLPVTSYLITCILLHYTSSSPIGHLHCSCFTLIKPRRTTRWGHVGCPRCRARNCQYWSRADYFASTYTVWRRVTISADISCLCFSLTDCKYIVCSELEMVCLMTATVLSLAVLMITQHVAADGISQYKR